MGVTERQRHWDISNNPSFRQKHPGVPVGSDGSDGTSYPLTEKYTFPVTQVTSCVAYIPPLLCARNVVTYPHHQNDTCVTLFAGAAVIISKNPSFRQKHSGVPDGSEGFDGTSYPLTENYTFPVAQVTGRIAYLPPLLYVRSVVTYMYHQNNTCVILFAGAAVMR